MRAPQPRFLGSGIYRGSSYGAHHPLRVPRVPTVMDLCRAMGWFGPGQYMTSPRAKPAALEAWHDPDYLEALQRAEAQGDLPAHERERYQLGTLSNPIYPEVFRRPATGAGGVMLAAQLLREGGIVHVPGGGTHHGLPAQANGFCYLNDAVLAVLALRAAGLSRIAYVDIDAHHPDGVELAFARDPGVLMISMHEERRWPFTGALQDEGAGQVFNLPLPRGAGDDEAALFRDAVMLPAVAAFRPEAVVLQCGADAVSEDPLSRLEMSNNTHFAIAAALMPMAPRLLVLGGGGYNPWSVGRLWSGVWAQLNGLLVPPVLPAPGQAVLGALSFPGHRLGRNPPAAWMTTIRDAPRPGPLRDELRGRVARLSARLRAWV